MPDAADLRAALDAIATAAGGAGPARRGGPGSAFPIEAGTRAWLVREGCADVFYEPESGGGPRRHVCRVEAGSALLALPALEGAGRVRAVPGPDAALVDVELARLLLNLPAYALAGWTGLGPVTALGWVALLGYSLLSLVGLYLSGRFLPGDARSFETSTQPQKATQHQQGAEHP